MITQLVYHGAVPAPLSKATLRAAAEACACAAMRWQGKPWQEVTIHLLHDKMSAEVNDAIMGHVGPTDVITQRFDPFPGEPEGLIGELYVNFDEAARNVARLGRTTLLEEVVLYIAHGCDHLTGSEDDTSERRQAMRRRDLRWMHAALAKLD